MWFLVRFVSVSAHSFTLLHNISFENSVCEYDENVHEMGSRPALFASLIIVTSKKNPAIRIENGCVYLKMSNSILEIRIN